LWLKFGRNESHGLFPQAFCASSFLSSTRAVAGLKTRNRTADAASEKRIQVVTIFLGRIPKWEVNMSQNLEHPSILRTTRSDASAFWMAISSIAACVATLFAGWAALETRSSAIEANRATRASVWLQVLGEYGSPEILASMKELRAWQQQRPEDFAETFKVLLNKAKPHS
jgi:hypothetical protein